jgi:hypothetical protein
MMDPTIPCTPVTLSVGEAHAVLIIIRRFTDQFGIPSEILSQAEAIRCLRGGVEKLQAALPEDSIMKGLKIVTS